MTETVTIDLGDGTTVRAEVIGEVNFQQQDGSSAKREPFGDARLGGGARRATEQLGEAVALTLDQVRATVQGVGRWAAESIAQDAAGSPDAFEVEFGLKLAVKSGQLLGVIAEAGGEAGLTVRLSWDLAERRRRTAQQPSPLPGAADAE
ncbi:CU044_2847 family protein [Kitasatospora sp. NPDC059463]|uniref:CU044_2847 family protein n=1 Tax=unclassified Kitasatospora TaxID=2633591 RepID=UPI0036A2BB7E